MDEWLRRIYILNEIGFFIVLVFIFTWNICMVTFVVALSKS